MDCTVFPTSLFLYPEDGSSRLLRNVCINDVCLTGAVLLRECLYYGALSVIWFYPVTPCSTDCNVYLHEGLCAGKCKALPVARHEGPEGEWRYSFTLSLTFAPDGVGFNATPRPLYPWEKDPVSILQEAGWASEPFWTGFDPRTV